MSRSGIITGAIDVKKALKVFFKGLWKIIYATGAGASQDNVPRLGAALSFYSLFSIGPFFLILMTILTLLYGNESGSAVALSTLSNVIGEGAAKVISQMLRASDLQGQTNTGAFIGIAAFALSAGAAFRALEDALNYVFGVRRRTAIVIAVSQKFVFSTLYAILIGSLFALMFFMSTIIFSGIEHIAPEAALTSTTIRRLLTIVGLYGVLVFLYRAVPGVRPPWKPVLISSGITMSVVMAGQFAMSAYLGSGANAGLIGAAGSIVVVMLWVYFSAQLVLLGAELVKALSNGKIKLREGYCSRWKDLPVAELEHH